jgi:P2-related tail formation protein
MTDTEAARLLVTMQAAWPGFAEDDGANRMWLTVIARSNPQIGAAACKSVINHLKFKPTIADWNEAIRDAYRYEEPGSARAEIGYNQTPASENVAQRLRAELEHAKEEREQRLKTMSADEFIRSEGHDPRTHRLSKGGYVLRRVVDGIALR